MLSVVFQLAHVVEHADFPEPDPADVPALGFLAVGPYANRDPLEALDDWIDVTSRGLMGVTAACARCHDHKFEPIPTRDDYARAGRWRSTRSWW